MPSRASARGYPRSRPVRIRLERLEDRTVPSAFSWRVDASGTWSNPNNWTLLSGTLGAGFPNAVGDSVLLVDTITANRTITIPDDVTITIGSLQINDSHNYTVAAAGTGKLVLDNTGSSNATLLVANSLGNSAPTISTRITLADTLELTNQSTGTLTLSGTIGESGTGRGLIADGTGTVRLSGAASNAFSGDTTVQSGTLELAKAGPTATVAVPGNLTVNGGTVRELVSNQVADGAAVSVGAGATFDLNGQSDAVGPLTVTGGSVTVGDGLVSFASLTMTGGSVTATAAGEIQFQGDATINASATGSAISGGHVQLGSATRTFTVADGTAAVDLDIKSEIRQATGGTAGLTKAGPGTLRLEGGTSNSYTGATTVNAGTLDLNKIGTTSIAVAVAGNLTVNGGTVREVVFNQIADTASVTVNAGGTFDLNGQSDTVGPLTVAGGTVTIGGGQLTAGNTSFNAASTLVMNLAGATTSGRVTVNGTAAVGGALQLSLSSPVAPGTSITLLDNDGTDAVTGTFAGLPSGTVLLAGGQTFVISYSGGTGNDVVLTRVALAPRVAGVAVNGGLAQRSMVTSLQVTFSAVVTLPANVASAFTLTRISDNAPVSFSASAATVGGVTVVTLSGFTGAASSFGSLADGRYSLHALSAQIKDATGTAFLDGNGDGAGGGNAADDFVFADSGTTSGSQLFRLFGDGNGDRAVNGLDIPLFVAQLNMTGTGLAFDFNADGAVNGLDITPFVNNLNKTI